MRIEELIVLQDVLPRQAWQCGKYEEEMGYAEAMLAELFSPERVEQVRQRWRTRIETGRHLIPEVGVIRVIERV